MALEMRTAQLLILRFSVPWSRIWNIFQAVMIKKVFMFSYFECRLIEWIMFVGFKLFTWKLIRRVKCCICCVLVGFKMYFVVWIHLSSAVVFHCIDRTFQLILAGFLLVLVYFSQLSVMFLLFLTSFYPLFAFV